MVPNITREELKAKMDRGDDFVLVEALSQKHYESSHLPGAINLPNEFMDEAGKLLPSLPHRRGPDAGRLRRHHGTEARARRRRRGRAGGSGRSGRRRGRGRRDPGRDREGSEEPLTPLALAP